MYHFTEEALRAIECARFEAARLGLPTITPERFLSNILLVDRSAASFLDISVIGISRDSARQQLCSMAYEKEASVRSAGKSLEEYPYTKILRYAEEEAKKFNYEEIGGEFLILGIMRVAMEDEQSVVTQFLKSRNLTPHQVYAALTSRIASPTTTCAMPLVDTECKQVLDRAAEISGGTPVRIVHLLGGLLENSKAVQLLDDGIIAKVRARLLAHEIINEEEAARPQSVRASQSPGEQPGTAPG